MISNLFEDVTIRRFMGLNLILLKGYFRIKPPRLLWELYGERRYMTWWSNFSIYSSIFSIKNYLWLPLYYILSPINIFRLNALKKSGDEEWKKRVSRPLDLDRLERRSASPELTPPTVVKMREKKALDTPRPSSIADRLSALDNAQEGWRDRVGETDVKKFTIEHKITSSGMYIIYIWV